MLLQYAFDWTDETARAAQRVLANSMLLQPPTRQMFVDFGFESKACSALKSDHFDNQFLVSRIIFFSTYGTTVNLSELLTKHSLAQNIISDLAQHAKLLDAKHKGAQDQMQDMALAELLKLLFNITHFCKDKASLFDPAVKHIVPLFWKQDISDKRPFDPPFGPLVNALINLDFRSETAQAAFFPKDDATKVVARLSDLLDKGLKDYTGNDLEAIVAPLIGVVSDLYEQGPETAKASLRKRLLPTAEDRKNVLGKGDTLPSRLLKNSANPLAPKLATAISHLLFDLSDRDGHKFVENVGYGFASGFLFQNNIPVPASAQDGVKGTGQQRAVNPITGQFLDEEIYPDEIPMTDEEKEREAERLFVLFERFVSAPIPFRCVQIANMRTD